MGWRDARTRLFSQKATVGGESGSAALISCRGWMGDRVTVSRLIYNYEQLNTFVSLLNYDSFSVWSDDVCE